MKKKYRNKLPKGAEVKGYIAHVDNGEIVVEVELKDRFQPKDGDFCVSDNGYLFIFKNEYTSSHFERCASCYYGIDANGNLDYGLNYTIEDGRHATAKEKDAFLKRLEAEKRLRWNAETKKLESIRWRAEKGATYYYVDERGNVLACSDTHGCADDWRYFFRNYFKTRKAACPYAEKMKELFKNSKAE